MRTQSKRSFQHSHLLTSNTHPYTYRQRTPSSARVNHGRALQQQPPEAFNPAPFGLPRPLCAYHPGIQLLPHALLRLGPEGGRPLGQGMPVLIMLEGLEGGARWRGCDGRGGGADGLS